MTKRRDTIAFDEPYRVSRKWLSLLLLLARRDAHARPRACAEGEAKYWLEPAIELAHNYGLNERQLRSVKALIEAHTDDIRSSWARHFGG